MILTYSGNQPSLPLWITSMDQPSFEASTGNWKHSPSPSNSPKLKITQYVLGQNMQSSIWNLYSSYNLGNNLVLCHLSSSPLSKSSPFASSRSVIQKPSCKASLLNIIFCSDQHWGCLCHKMKWARVQLEWPQKQLKSLSQTDKMTLDDKLYHTLAASVKVILFSISQIPPD